MNFREQLARVIARDSRYPIEGYAFVLESLKLARGRKLRESRKREEQQQAEKPRRRPRAKPRPEDAPPGSGHVTGQEICHAARRLALRAYGGMAVMVLDQWGIRRTSDRGEIDYNLIASGDLSKTPEDRRSDFDDVYDFATALRPRSYPRKESAP
jgi:uncharacterized repeat protein (TIGR04138 family)